MPYILGKERLLHYLQITTGTDLCPIPKNNLYSNIILQTAITVKFEIGRQWKIRKWYFQKLEKLEGDK